MSQKEYELIEKAIIYIEKNYKNQPSLEDIAKYTGYSEYHFQKLFKNWAGLSPKKFLEYVTLKHAKALLKKSKSILETSGEVGLSSQSRLYDLFVNFEAVTPGDYKLSGENLEIVYGINETPFGQALVAKTKRGLTDLRFINEGLEKEIRVLKKRWPKAGFIEKSEETREFVDKIFSLKGGKPKLNLYLKGTNFQIKVWQALLKIPEGYLASYSDIAEYINNPKAVRAVGTAIGDNPLHYIIPCHRVLRGDGSIGGYAAGTARKRAIILSEIL